MFLLFYLVWFTVGFCIIRGFLFLNYKTLNVKKSLFVGENAEGDKRADEKD